MRMYQYDKHLDFHALGREIKRKREEKDVYKRQAIGRRGEWNPGVAFHLIDDPAFLGNVLGVVFIHYVFERGKIIFALVAVHAIGNGHQPYIMEREKFFGELAHLNVCLLYTSRCV